MNTTRRKFLLAYSFTTNRGDFGNGRTFGTGLGLTEQAIKEWETAIASANGFRHVSLTNVVELEG